MSQPAIKTFNTTGPCVLSKHYMLPVLPRQSGVDEMIEGEYYFVLHAPRQSGKTTFLKAQTAKINSEGKYYALNCSLMTLRDEQDETIAMSKFVARLNFFLKSSSVQTLKEKAYIYNSLPGMDDPVNKISVFLNNLCEDLDKELVVFFDDSDCLSGSALITFLAQIRESFQIRDQPGNKFPRSMALVGMRDIRDYLIHVRPEEASKGLASPFNIKKEAFTLPNFTQEEIGTLYRQHTKASGQIFDDEAVARAWHWSEGQPWLVNALAYEAVVEILKKDYSAIVTAKIIEQAAENLIKRRDTHIDSLLERLKEPRVGRVMNAVFAGTKLRMSKYADDRQYCVDLGLVALGENDNLRPANALYQEVMSRVLTDSIQSLFDNNIGIKKWNNGKIVFISDILKAFQVFWRENAFLFPLRINEPEIESFKDKISDLDNTNLILEILDLVSRKYDEAVYYLIMMAFLQRVVNGGALVHRQFAEGRGAVDLRVDFKGQKYLIECKIKGRKSEDDSFDQLVGYLDSAGEKEGWLVIFDRDRKKNWDKKITWKTTEVKGFTIHVVGC
jgi:hypothetical protein